MSKVFYAQPACLSLQHLSCWDASKGKDKSGIFNAAMKANLGEPVLAGLDRMQTTCFYCCSPCFLATVPILWVISFRVHSFNNLIKYIIEDAIKILIFQISWLPALHCTSDSLCFTFMESTSQQPSAFASRKFSDSSAQPVGLGIWPIALPTIDQTRCAYKTEYQDCQLTKVLSGSSRS